MPVFVRVHLPYLAGEIGRFTRENDRTNASRLALNHMGALFAFHDRSVTSIIKIISRRPVLTKCPSVLLYNCSENKRKG